MSVLFDLPDDVDERVKRAGLLQTARAAQLFAEILDEETDTRHFFELARDLRSVPGDPSPLNEIQIEVEVVRTKLALRL